MVCLGVFSPLDPGRKYSSCRHKAFTIDLSAQCRHDNTLRAKEMGYHAVLLAVPFYTKPTQAGIVAHFNAVIAATDMNIVLYAYPGKDGVEIAYEALDALADNPRIIGINESSGVMQRAIGISTRHAGRIQRVSGSDDIAWDFMHWGGRQLDLWPGQLHDQDSLQNGCRLPQGRSCPRQMDHDGDLARDERAGMARRVTPIMAARGGGSIVNITTDAALEPSLWFPASCVYRAGLRPLRSLTPAATVRKTSA